MARSGDIVFKWEQFKPLIKKKIQMIAAEFNEAHPCDPNLNQPNVKPFEFEEVKRNILNGIDSFTGAPFTIQRICELLTNPYKHYKRADKFLKGLEKNVMVISEETVDQSKTENGNTSGSGSICLNATFTMPSPSTSHSIGNNQSTAFHNGFKDSQPDDPILPQLDSFTSVFVSSSQTTTSHLERIASLQILEQSTTTVTTTLANQHSSSQLSAIQPFLATSSVTRIPRISDPALDSLEKITQEIPIIEQQQQQQPLGADVIIQTVNSGEPVALSSVNGGSEQIVVPEDEDKCLEADVDKAVDEQVASEEAAVVGVAELSEQPQNLSDQLLDNANSEQQKEETKPPVKDQGKDLKRMHEDDEVESADESFKRFKSDDSFADDEQVGIQESAEQASRVSIDQSEAQLEDKKEELPTADQELPNEQQQQQSISEQAEVKDDHNPEAVSENRPLEVNVSSNENASEPDKQPPSVEPSNGEALVTDGSGDKLNELKLVQDLKENDDGQEKAN